MYNFPFDQYQRYKTTSLIIENIRTQNECFSILEIGANEHKNLEKFLPNEKIRYLDINLPEALKDDPKYILADATNMPQINDNSFDIVIALDVFEHIPKDLRKKFLKEIQRVSKKMFILAGPFDETGVNEAEIRVNQYYKTKFGEDYIWLKEHIENGLPNLNKTVNFLNSTHNNKLQVFKHGSLEVWEQLIRLHFEVADNSVLQDYRMEIDKYYNEYIYKNDISEKCYRNFLIFSKDENQVSDVFTGTLNDKTFSKLDYFNDLVESCYRLSLEHKFARESSKYIQLYVECENEINEEDSIILPYQNNTKIIFDLTKFKSIKSLRFDPLNEYVVLKLNFIKIGNQNIESTFKSNAIYVKNNIYYFNTNDSQIYLDGVKEAAESIVFDLEFLHIGEDALSQVANVLSKTLATKEQNIETLNEELTTKEQNIETLNEELTTKEQNIQTLNEELTTKEQNIEEKSLDMAIIKQRLKLYHPDNFHKILGDL